MTEYFNNQIKKILTEIQTLELNKAEIDSKLEANKEALKQEILTEYGDTAEGDFKQKDDDVSVAWFIPAKAKRFQQAEFQKAHPDLFESFKKEATTDPKPQLKITFSKK